MLTDNIFSVQPNYHNLLLIMSTFGYGGARMRSSNDALFKSSTAKPSFRLYIFLNWINNKNVSKWIIYTLRFDNIH